MQERYLGDSHDYIKYALLRHLSNDLGLRLGVNWYLTFPEDVDRQDSKDGEKRHHLKGQDWQDLDSDLFNKIKYFDIPETRKLENVAKQGILPSQSLYFSDPVPKTDRHVWHQQAQDVLYDADLVFIDPDNGFEIKSMSRKTSPKYALYKEAADYLTAGKIVLGIQFARQCDPIKKGYEIREKLCDATGASQLLPIIRGRVAPNILFLTLSPSSLSEKLRRSLVKFADLGPKVNLIE